MSTTELENYRRVLMTLGSRIRGDAAQVQQEALRPAGGEASGSLSNTPFHLADLGTDAFEQEVSANLYENEGQLLEQIRAALARIDQGTFGRCQECGQEIGARRLQALPYTAYCIACARKLEEEGGTPTRAP
jgi:RNA polymerase-binding protein DksA